MGDRARTQVLTDLYREHAGVLFSFVRRYVDAPAAEDVVQETMLRTWRSIDRLRLDGNPRAYLFTIARNVLTDRWKAEQRRPRLADAAVDPDASWAPTVADVDAAVERWAVEDALSALSPEHRTVIRALHFDGLSVAEAARRLGVPEGTVKSRTYYGLRALRSVLEEKGVLG